MMRHLSHIFFVDAETFTGSCPGWRWRGGGHRYGTEVPLGVDRLLRRPKARPPISPTSFLHVKTNPLPGRYGDCI